MSDWLNEVYGWAREKMGGQKRLTPEQEYYRLHGEFPPPDMDPTVSIDAAEPEIGPASEPESPGTVATKLDIQRRVGPEYRPDLLREQAMRPAPPEGLSVTDAEEPFVGPIKPEGPEYRPELLKTAPKAQVRVSAEAPQKQPFGPEYRPDLLNPDRSAEQPVFAERAPQQPVPQPQPQESAPYDRSGWYAALRGIANAGGLAKTMGMEPSTAYYDTKIAQEQQKQKDWKDRLALQLKQKFEQEQQGRDFEFRGKEGGLDRTSREGIASKNLASEEARAKASRELTEAGQRQADKHFWANYNRMGEQFKEGQASTQNRADTVQARIVSEKLPSPAAFAAGREVKKLLSTGQTPAGFGKIANAAAKLGIPFGQWGANAGEIVRQAMLTPEEARQWNDAYTLTMMTAFDLGGKALTEGEKEPVELMAGIRGGQGPEVLKHGLLRMINAQEEKVKRGYSVLGPGGQSKLRDMGFSPETWGAPPEDDELIPDGGR